QGAASVVHVAVYPLWSPLRSPTTGGGGNRCTSGASPLGKDVHRSLQRICLPAGAARSESTESKHARFFPVSICPCKNSDRRPQAGCATDQKRHGTAL